MKKKGFTLVELLAVIAILAILVVIAMPNIIDMFNNAKQNIFVTEIHRYVDSAKLAYTSDVFSNPGKSIYYSSEENLELNTLKLDIEADKKYFIEMDSSGSFKRIVIYDDNFCYDVYSDNTKGNVSSTKSKKISNFDKSSVNKDDLWLSNDDKINIVATSDGYTVVGCTGSETVTGESSNIETDVFYVFEDEYQYIPGMTWEEWINSSYNVDNFYIFSDTYIHNDLTLLRYPDDATHVKKDETISSLRYVHEPAIH